MQYSFCATAQAQASGTATGAWVIQHWFRSLVLAAGKSWTEIWAHTGSVKWVSTGRTLCVTIGHLLFTKGMMSGRLLAIFLPSDKWAGKLGTRVPFSLFQAGGETHSAVPWGKQWRKERVTWSSWTNPGSAGLYFSFLAVMRKNTQPPEVPSSSHWPSGALTMQTAMASSLSSGGDSTVSLSRVAATFLFSWQVPQALVPCLLSSKGSIPSLQCIAWHRKMPAHLFLLQAIRSFWGPLLPPGCQGQTAGTWQNREGVLPRTVHGMPRCKG